MTSVLTVRLALLRDGAERLSVDRFVVAAWRVHFDSGRFAASAFAGHGCARKKTDKSAIQLVHGKPLTIHSYLGRYARAEKLSYVTLPIYIERENYVYSYLFHLNSEAFHQRSFAKLGPQKGQHKHKTCTRKCISIRTGG